MVDGSVSAAVQNGHDLAALYRQQRSHSISSADSGVAFISTDKLPHTKNENTIVLHPPLSELPEVENTLGGNLQIIEHSEACLASTTELLPDQYEQIHTTLLRAFKVVEDTTEKLCISFNADKLNNAFKKEDISEEADTDLSLFKEIPKFKALFCEVKEAIHGLKTDSYSKDALKKLEIAQVSLSEQHAILKSNLPAPQSKAFKIFNYVLEGLGTLITIISIALMGLGVAISTTAPCTAAAAIYLIVRAWREKVALPEANKNMYLTSLEKLYADTFSALKTMDEDMLTIELREANAALLAAQRKNAEAQRQQIEEANQKQLEATQKILDAMSRSTVEKAPMDTLVAVITSAPTISKEQREALSSWLERTPSPDSDRVPSNLQTASAVAFVDQV